MFDSSQIDALRSRVLDAWRASPARLREDANAEEDLFRGGYRDRLVVELAQNAADAATRAGVSGRLLLGLEGSRLVVANTGSPLDVAGVEALSTLRASAKRDDDSVGRFGVGFAASRAVSDEITLGSRSTGAVRWSLHETQQALADLGLLDSVADRGISLPVLRLPHSTSVDVADGYETAVTLQLRDDDARAAVIDMLRSVDAPLLLSLPALTEVVVTIDGDTRTWQVSHESLTGITEISLDGVVHRWLVITRDGDIDASLMTARPVEERLRTRWSVSWALPLDGPVKPGWPQVVHAPTPTDEPLGLPALLIAALPLEPTRRRAAPGPLLTSLLRAAGAAYADLVVRAGSELDAAHVLALLPGPAALGELDAQIRQAALAALAQAPFLPAADGVHRLRPRDAVVVDAASDDLLGALIEVVDGLLPAVAARRAGELERLGVRRLRVADLIDAVAGVNRPAGWWRTFYDALGDQPPDALAALPVPLVDGRLVRGARGTLLADTALPAEALRVLGLRVVDPDASHALLERLGATRSTARSVVVSDDVRAAVEGSHRLPDADAREVTDAVLALLVLLAREGSGGLQPAEAPWLGGLLLTDEHGDLAPARALVLPGAALAALVDRSAVDLVDPDLVASVGRDVLVATGVLDSFAVLRDEDVLLDSDAIESLDHDLDDEDGWVDAVAGGGGAVASEFAAVRDLDLVSDASWPAALALLAQAPLRDVVVRRTRVLAGGIVTEQPSYSAWWLAQHAHLAGVALTDFRVGSDDALAGLWEPWPQAVAVDAAFAQAVGVRSSLEALLAEPDGPQEVLDRLADPARDVSASALLVLMAGLSSVAPVRVHPPDDVRVSAGHATRVVAAVDALVLDRPDLLAVLPDVPLVLVAHDRAIALADVLGLDLASDVVDRQAPEGGDVRQVPQSARRLLPTAPQTWVEHDDIVVEGVSIDWRVVDGVVHACTGDGLAKGLAWAADRWEQRWLVGAILAEPERGEELLADAALDRARRGD